MTVLTNHRLGEPCWVDYMCSDVPRARGFYQELFGWKGEVGGGEYGGYVTFRKDGRLVAGLGAAMGAEQPDAWTTYLLVEDADAAEKSAMEAGATVVATTMEVGAQGRLAIVQDPGGAVIGLWESGEHRGFELVAEAGGTAWHELYARDFAAQVDFYTKVFDWRTNVLSDTSDFRYVTFGDQESPTGGVFDAGKALPEGVPSHWSVYFGVTDVDASVARVTELGGNVLRDPWESEFGRFAQVTDPLGGLFFLCRVDQPGT